MHAKARLPCALTIAGSDSGGGAGIQADLKTFAALKVHGLSVITCVTAQSPLAVRGIEPCSAAIVQRQLKTVLQEFRPAAIKTGMLFSASIIRAIAPFFNGRRGPALVVDPVMVSTSGGALLQPKARRALCEKLIPYATLLTPNLPEAEALTGERITTLGQLKDAAVQLYAAFGCAILAKGGHLRSEKGATDVFFDGKHGLLLSAPFVRGVKTHGTGCTYSAAITAHLARGYSLSESVRKAKRYVTRAIRGSQLASGYDVLSW